MRPSARQPLATLGLLAATLGALAARGETVDSTRIGGDDGGEILSQDGIEIANDATLAGQGAIGMFAGELHALSGARIAPGRRRPR